MMKIEMTTALGKLVLKNPVLVASGTFGLDYKEIVDINRLGALVLKTVTLTPREGNSAARICETPSGMLNAIGLQNEGIEEFLNKLYEFSEFKVPIIANIAGDTIDEYAELARRLDPVRKIEAVELNVSCPNVKKGGMRFGEDRRILGELVKKVRRGTKKPIITKLTPNVTDIVSMAKSAEGAGSDIISLVNTFLAMAIDVRNRRPYLANITGGLSGPAIRPIAVRMVWQVAGAVRIPVIGMGGITCLEDALEFIIAGARAVAIGTGNFINPDTAIEIIEGLEQYMAENKIKKLSEIRGSMIEPT